MVEMVRQLQPAQRMSQMISVPLLMLNGVNDPLINLEGVRNFYQHIQPLYTNPEEVQLIEYPGVGHYTPYEMQIEALHWSSVFYNTSRQGRNVSTTTLSPVFSLTAACCVRAQQAAVRYQQTSPAQFTAKG